jgi:hypothetical protein
MSMVDINMTIGHAPVASLLTERPPEEHLLGHVPQQTRPGRDTAENTELHQQYEVVYADADGRPLLAFTDGQWWDMTSYTPRPVTVRFALRRDPSWAGAVVQTVCLWMRSHPNDERSFDLATELALAVGELARQQD